jgi:hypothetical protein
MAQKYLCQISANLWHKNIYVKFRQIYGTKILSNFGRFMAQKYLCQISANLWHKNIYVKFRQIYVKIVALAYTYNCSGA